MEKVIEKFLNVFGEISKIPRCSKNEEAIGDWLCEWADKHGLSNKRDKVGNVLIKVPASNGYEDKPTVVLQGHMDMVCEKGENCSHDFKKDGIKLVREGEWLHADDTTLGADNGVALAMALMLVEEDTKHPALELLFTVDEETGLTGANQLEPGFIDGKLLINLDSEDEGKFTIGCAGGKHVILDLPLEYDLEPENGMMIKIEVSGLLGGHSGVDINKNRGNAIKILSRVLYHLKSKYSFNIADISGGTAHNAISRQAECSLSIYPEDEEEIKQVLSDLESDYRREYADIESELSIKMSKLGKVTDILSEETTINLIDLLMALPHGISAMTINIAELVETSCNLALAKIVDKKFHVLISIRSSVLSRLRALCNRISSIGELAGAEITQSQGYPAWEPDTHSKLLNQSTSIYEKLHGKPAEVLVIHAGLECGVIGEKHPGMEMISFGPTIENAHSPRERLHLGSYVRVWEFLINLLKAID